MLSVLAAACARESSSDSEKAGGISDEDKTELVSVERPDVNHNDVVIVPDDTDGQDSDNAEDAQALGNRRFLILASLRRLAWAHARGDAEKSIVAGTLVNAVLKSKPTGRFLVRQKPKGDTYTQVDHEAATREARKVLDRQYRENLAHNSDENSVEAKPLPPSTIPTQPTISDVLCGRGAATNNHAGNLRFRALISLHQDQYLAAQNGEKAEISRSVVRVLRNFDPPGRFLKKDGASGLWYDIGEDKATEKTSQAFREKKVNQSPNLHLLFNKLPVLQLNRALTEQTSTPSRKRPADVSESDSGSVGCEEKRQRAVDLDLNELEDTPKAVNCTAV